MVPKIVLVFQTLKNKHPSYLFDIIPKVLATRTTRNHNNIPLFNVKHEFFRKSFFHPLLLSVITSLIFEIRNRSVYLKNKFLKLLDRILIVRLMCIILIELNYLQDYELGQVICVNTNLDAISKTP